VSNPDDNDIEIIAGDVSGVDDESDGKALTDLVEQPAKVMRIGTMIKQLLEEVRAAPLDDRQPQSAARHPPGQHPRARGRACPGTPRRAGNA